MHVSFKRTLSLLLVCLLLLFSMAGCGNSVKESSTSRKETYQDDQDYDSGSGYDQDNQDYNSSSDYDQDDQDYDSNSDYEQDDQDYNSSSDYDQDDQDQDSNSDYDQYNDSSSGYDEDSDSGSDYNQNDQDQDSNSDYDKDKQSSGASLDRDGSYTSKEDVADYLHQYGELPKNFITKKEARKLGWSGGSLEPYAPGKCIGGDHFGNYEGNLPEAGGRSYYECDIDTLGAKSRGPKRIVYSNDGLIYYTEDHYNTFTLLYGDE